MINICVNISVVSYRYAFKMMFKSHMEIIITYKSTEILYIYTPKECLDIVISFIQTIPIKYVGLPIFWYSTHFKLSLQIFKPQNCSSVHYLVADFRKFIAQNYLFLACNPTFAAMADLQKEYFLFSHLLLYIICSEYKLRYH